MTQTLETTKGSLSRQLILNVALDLFTRIGYDGTSIDDIRQAAGFRSKASLYTHFKSKEEVATALLSAILHDEEQVLTTAFLQAPADDPMAQFKGLARAFIEWGLTHPQDYAFCFLRIQQDNVIRGHQEAQPSDATMLDLLAHLRPHYALRDLSNEVLLSMITGLINKAVIDQAVFGPMSITGKTDIILELCLALLFK